MPPGEGRGPFGGGSVEVPVGAAFGRSPRSSADLLRRARALAVLLLLVVSALLIRAAWRDRPSAPLPILVQLGGEVPHPGIHALPEGATVMDALLEAGVDPATVSDPFVGLPLQHGYRVELSGDGTVRVWLAEERLLVGLPVDPNTADALLLQQLPGIGPGKAEAIIAERRANGPFDSVDALVRVRGIGPATLEQLRPFLGIDGISERPQEARDE
jgi:competence protein ComEA